MATVTGGRIVWNLDVDDKGFAAKMAAARASSQSFAQGANKDLGSVEHSTGRLGAAASTFAKTAAVAVGVGLGAWAVSSIKSAAAMEQNRIAFETMLGSGQKAATMLKEIEAFALKTPFNLPQVVEGAKSLLAYGISAEKILPTFNALGNIAAGVGRDKLPQLTLAFGQVRAAGRLTGMELRQFTEAGVPLLEVLGKQMGKSTAEIKEMVEAGKIGFPEVERALFSMSEAGGRFENLMARQAKTLSGSWTNFIDTLGKVGRALVGVSSTGEIRAGSLFDTMAKGLSVVTDFLVKNEGAITQFGIAMQEGLGTAIGFVIKGFQTLSPILTEVWNFLMTMFKPAWDQLKEALASVSPQLTAAAQALGGTLLVAIVAIVLALGLFIYGLIKLVTVTIQVFNAIYDAASAILSPVIDVVTYVGKAIYNIIIVTMAAVFAFWQAIWNNIKGIVLPIVNGIVAAVSTISRIVGIVAGAISGAYNAVAGFVGRFFSIGLEIINGIVRGMANAAGAVIRFIDGLIGDVIAWAKKKLGIGSPSKVFMAIGQDMMLGMAIGIEQGLSQVQGALSPVITPEMSADSVGSQKPGASVIINAKQLTESDIDMGANRALFKTGQMLKGQA